MTNEKKPRATIVATTGRSTFELFAPGAGPAEIKDPITKAPDVQFDKGRAWRCDLAEGRRIMKVNPKSDPTLEHWIVEAPWAHPVWHSYSIALIHLRETPGLPPPHLALPMATHEMWVYALNPDMDRNELLRTAIVDGQWLTPMNFGAQFIEITDELARARIRSSVELICKGRLSPDTDCVSSWVILYNNSLIKKEYR